MKKLYDKNKLSFALVWIGLYCLLQSLANPLSEALGLPYAAQAAISLLLAAVLLRFLGQNGLFGQFGLCRSRVPARRLLWYLPLLLLASSNLWQGASLNLPLGGTICYLFTMLCVGFLEELIFRGFLFKAMAESNIRSAILVSSLTFGLGHLLNLVNGSGMDLLSNLCQVFSAIAIGFLFVLLFYYTGSLLPCIFTHSAINMLSAFANEAAVTPGSQLVLNLILIAISLAYALFLVKRFGKGSLAI